MRVPTTPPAGPFDDRLDPAMIPVLRAKTPAERTAMADAMWASARDMITNLLGAQHPDWTPARVAAEVARRLSRGAA